MRLLAILFIAAVAVVAVAEKDPKACEVCIKVINNIKEASKGVKDLEAIEGKLQSVCSKLTTPQEKKLCYYIEPIQREVSRPISNGLPADKICQRLKKSSGEICNVKFPDPAAEKQEAAAAVDPSKMTLKQLRQVLAKRGVSCEGCIEKSDFVRKVEETKNLPNIAEL